MTDRNHLWVVALAGVTSGVGAASVNIAARFTDDPSDVLGFFGGALGAGLAVLGTLMIERVKNRDNERNRTRIVANALISVARRATHAGKAIKNDEALPIVMKARTLSLDHTIGTFQRLRARYTLESSEREAALDTFENMLVQYRPDLQKFATVAGDDEQIDVSQRRRMQIRLDWILQSINTLFAVEIWAPGVREEAEQLLAELND